jgi:septum formation protein
MASKAHQTPPVSTLVLASGSTWRRELLESAGLAVVAEPARIDEDAVFADDPVGLAEARARAKAVDVAARHPGAVVLGADQVVHLDGRPFFKPKSRSDWLASLRRLRGRTHKLTTAVVLAWPDGSAHRLESFSVHTSIRFRADLQDAELEAYVEHGEASGCAGGYMVERHGAWLIEAVEGDWTNVVGLPVLAVVGRLRAGGWTYPPGRE